MSELLIARISRRAADQQTRTDMVEMLKGKLAARLKRADAEASEQALGFSVPELLKLVYDETYGSAR
jgi:hypothetical protein